MADDPILAETRAAIGAILGPDLAGATIARAVVGLYFTGVELDIGAAGACATPARAELHEACCPGTRAAVLHPGTLRGRLATEVLDALPLADPLRRAVAIATLNALAEACWQRRPHPNATLKSGVDAFDAAAIAPGEHVVLVGAFIPFLRALKRMRQDYTVLELSPAMLKADELPHYRPATDAAEVLPRADVILITGSTLLHGTMDGLLRQAQARPDARVVVAGPTVGLMPDPLFRRGVDVVGGVRVTNPAAFLEVLAEGGSGQEFFGRSADRVVLVPNPVPERKSA